MPKHWNDLLNEFGKNKKSCFFLIDFEGNNAEIYPLETLEKNEIFFDFSAKKNQNSTKEKLCPSPIPFINFETSFNKIMKGLKRGDSYLANLTFSTPIQPIDLQEVFKKTWAKYKILYKNKWVCFSPESFIKITDNQVFTYPMKGTINAHIPNAKKLLLENKKEQAEHATIVDLLRNDLSLISDNVIVTKYRYTEKIQTQKGEIWQTSSEIKGDLQENWQENLGNLLKKILPAGSISGAPKKKTLELIQSAETHQRGFYTGIAGIFTGTTLDTCVLIRFIENIDNQYFYKSGSGITTQSNCLDEYNEIQQKIYLPKCVL